MNSYSCQMRLSFIVWFPLAGIGPRPGSSGVGMNDRKDSSRAFARLTGVLYLYIMITGMFAEAFVRDKLVIMGDPAATMRNITSSEMLWRWGIVAEVSATLCDIAVAVLLYFLLRPAGRVEALTAAFFRLAYAAAMTVNAAFLLGPLLLDSASPRSASEVSQVQSLTMYSLHLHAAGFDVALVLFGVHLVLVGIIIARSGLLPKSLGAALAIAGVCYMANSFIGFLAPSLVSRLFPWLLLPGFLSEAALTLWLLTVGINQERRNILCLAERA